MAQWFLRPMPMGFSVLYKWPNGHKWHVLRKAPQTSYTHTRARVPSALSFRLSLTHTHPPHTHTYTHTHIHTHTHTHTHIHTHTHTHTHTTHTPFPMAPSGLQCFQACPGSRFALKILRSLQQPCIRKKKKILSGRVIHAWVQRSGFAGHSVAISADPTKPKVRVRVHFRCDVEVAQDTGNIIILSAQTDGTLRPGILKPFNVSSCPAAVATLVVTTAPTSAPASAQHNYIDSEKRESQLCRTARPTAWQALIIASINKLRALTSHLRHRDPLDLSFGHSWLF